MPRLPESARLIGSYTAPAVSVGDEEDCRLRGVACRVMNWTDARISWPRGIPVGGTGAPSIIVTAELERAIRNESAEAIGYWWGVTCTVIWKWRKAFGVTPVNNPRSHELIVTNSAKGSEIARSVPLSDQVRAKRRRRAVEHGYDKFLREGYRRTRQWPEEHLALLGTMPDAEVAALTHQGEARSGCHRWWGSLSKAILIAFVATLTCLAVPSSNSPP
jgi:hypothetical protein